MLQEVLTQGDTGAPDRTVGFDASAVGERLHLQPGESIYYDGNVEHAWTSTGDTDAEVLGLISTR